jgi:hypothetical protein
VTVTVNDASRPYGEQNPKFSAQVSGLPDGARLQLDFSTDATPDSPVGSYAIQAEVKGQDDGFQVVLVPGTLKVTKAPLTVTPRDVDRLYGAENPPLTGRIDGARSQDQISATYTTTATRTSPPGAYPISAVLSDPNGRLGNYSVTLLQGTLTVRSVPPVPTGPDCRDITVTGGAGGPEGHMHCPLSPDAVRQAVQGLTQAPADAVELAGAATAQVHDVIARAQVASDKAPLLVLETGAGAAVQGAAIDRQALAKLAQVNGAVGIKTGYGALLLPHRS